jgi:hypothetical protein
VANRRITELPSILGADLSEQDLLTLVKVFEVDPTLKNKKITLEEFNNYLETKYLPYTGGVITGPITIQSGQLINSVSGTFSNLSGTIISGVSGYFTTFQATNVLYSGNNIFSGDTRTLGSGYFSSGINVTGTVSGQTFTGQTAQFTDITGSTLTVTLPSGSGVAINVSGLISGGVSGIIVKGPFIILP